MMKKLTFIASLLVVLVGFEAKSQDFGEIFKAGTEDAELYIQEYTEPIMLSFNNGLAAGWVNTAKPHKLLGFDLTLGVNIANIPSNDRKFNFNDYNWENLELVSGDPELPSAVGGPTVTRLRIPAGTPITDSETGASISYEDDVTFDAPEGFDAEDLPIVGFPVPTLQLGLGLPKNTDLKIRYASDFGALGDDGSFNLFGIGVLHDLKQWIPGLKQIPFDASGFMGYTRLSSDFDISIQDPEFSADGVAELKASTFTLGGYISKKFAIFTPYVGIGYNIASSKMNVKGDFTYTDTGDGTQVTIRNPLNLKFDGGSSPRLNFGLRIKLLILTLHAEYALQKYSTVTAGVGLSIR